MTRPKRHHFVPQWYLEGFVDPQYGLLHAYDKTREIWWTPKPKNVMVIKDYYQQNHAPEGVDPDILERRLGEWFEQEAKRALEKLLTHPNDLTGMDTSYILIYLEHQRICVPRQIERAKQVTKSMLLERVPPEIMTPEVMTAIIRGEITIEINDDYRFNIMKLLTRKLFPYFAQMVWDIVTAEEGCSFITSDSPVSFCHPNFRPPMEAGIALVGTRVLFPLDSQHLLILQHPEYKNGSATLLLEQISEPLLEDKRISINYGRQFTEHQVNLSNSIMLDRADRIIVGKSKEILEKAVALSVIGPLA